MIEHYKITEMRSCMNTYKRVYRFTDNISEHFIQHLSVHGKLKFVDFGALHKEAGKCFFIKNGYGLTISGVTGSPILRLAMMKKQTQLLYEIDNNINRFFSSKD